MVCGILYWHFVDVVWVAVFSLAVPVGADLMAGTTGTGNQASRTLFPDDRGGAPPDRPTDVPVLALLFAVVASPFIWMGHLALGARPCRLPVPGAHDVADQRAHGRDGAADRGRPWSSPGGSTGARGPRPLSRAAAAVAFIALVGFGWAVISLYATVLEGIPNIVGVSSCPR